MFHDKDGSVGGVPDSFIVINGGIALDDACEVEAHLERCGVQGRCRAREYWRGRWRRRTVRRRCRSWRCWAGGPGGPGAAKGGERRSLAVPALRRAGPAVLAQVMVVAVALPETAPLDPLSQRSLSAENGKDFPTTAANQRASGYRGQGDHGAAEHVNLSVSSEPDAGSWVIFELPGFTTLRRRVRSRAARTHFARPPGDLVLQRRRFWLWVKLVSSGDVARQPDRRC